MKKGVGLVSGEMARSVVLEGRVEVVDLDGVVKCVDEIRWNTTVGDLLCR